MNRPHPTSEVDRLRLYGPAALGDTALLSVLIGHRRTGAEHSLAGALLAQLGGLAGLARAGVRPLAKAGGVGPVRAARILAGLELGRRATVSELETNRETISTFDAAVNWAHPRLAGLDHEEVWILGLDGNNGLGTARRVAQGGMHGASLLPRDVLRPALRDGASAIVLVHNHPSGDPSPSPDDVEMTRALDRACQVVGITLLDHVVVARHGSQSLLELGVFDR